jgi:hypothetical protein
MRIYDAELAAHNRTLKKKQQVDSKGPFVQNEKTMSIVQEADSPTDSDSSDSDI